MCVGLHDIMRGFPDRPVIDIGFQSHSLFVFVNPRFLCGDLRINVVYIVMPEMLVLCGVSLSFLFSLLF